MINDRRSTIDPHAAWNELAAEGVGVVTLLDATYPPLLRQIAAPPPLLTFRGQLPTEPCVAIVGTRSCTSYGRAIAKKLAGELCAAGATVVSGLAYGIDAAAHVGAVGAGGETVAVVGTGLAWDVTYPAEHRNLAEKILATDGWLISEHGLRMPSLPGHFPRRNRIISGLCRATVVVEAGERSGALLTAHLALEQNREVLAVPGPITSAASAGTNRLIAQGAKPALSASDVLEAIGLGQPEAAAQPPPPAPPLGLSAAADATLSYVIRSGHATPDEVAEVTGLPSASIAAALTELELAGLVERRGASVRRI
jgi:DNA processing protein